MKALILAAGIGSRLGLDIPKPMYEIEEKPVLEHNILLLKKYGIKDIVINLHYRPEIIKEYFEDGKKRGVNISYSYEEELLGTSGAVKKVNLFEDEVGLIVYGDNFTDINLKEMLEAHNESKPYATIALFDPNKNVNSGIAGGKVNIDNNRKIISFTEGSDNSSNGYVNAGIYVLDQKIFDIIPEGVSDFGKDIFPKLLESNKTIKGYITDSFVLAIDTKEALASTQEQIKKEK